MSETDLSRYLRPTEFCDCDHPSLKEFAQTLGSPDQDPISTAVAIFYFVRDNIKSGMDRFDLKASQTYVKKYGGCVGKSNLQIALLRAAGIPARYAHINMSKEVLRPLDTFGLSHLAFQKIPPLLPHVVCSVYLKEKWLFAEAAFDKEMFEMFFAANFSWDINWDGQHDLLVAREFFVGNFSFYDSMDDDFARNFGALPPLFLSRPMFSAANIYSSRLRGRHRRKRTD
ncbi:transglutaminase domain-containing protein [candidate division CSSED10-310 bacterium]|uniref:Transglutaminase domain-containing protein n=1 Tax=candidate division CSSED10-310 bacterium TaxID=2855610 RepID=A0ABV6Z547_UNCC1